MTKYSEMTIRKADSKRDAAAIAAIYNPFITDTVVTFETEPLSVSEMEKRIAEIAGKFPYLVCETDGELAGYAYVHTWRGRKAFYRTAETSVYIAPGYRRMGVGKMLMDTLIKECSSRGLRALIAVIDGENEESFRFHESLGFRRVAAYRQVGYKFGRWLDLVSYELLIPECASAGISGMTEKSLQ